MELVWILGAVAVGVFVLFVARPLLEKLELRIHEKSDKDTAGLSKDDCYPGILSFFRKRKGVVFLGALVGVAGLILLALNFTAPVSAEWRQSFGTGKQYVRTIQPGAFGVKWGDQIYLAAGAITAAIGALTALGGWLFGR